jgi:Uma2 family endonuclease
LLREDPLTFVDSQPEPDLAIVRGEEQDFTTSHPTTAELVIEIAIPSVALDREKAAIYAEAGVAEFWIVLPAERRVEVYRQPENGAYSDLRVIEGNVILSSWNLEMRTTEHSEYTED